MRFRLGVEPLVWIVTILGAAGCLNRWRAWRAEPARARAA